MTYRIFTCKKRRLLFVALLFIQINKLYAAQLEINIVDKNNNAFEGAVVEILHPSLSGIEGETKATELAEMRQSGQKFEPQLLLIRQGDLVSFPNLDSTKHHVYSFSDAKTFQLPLFREELPEPILFDKHGIVSVGCNVHDWMSGFIYVAKSSKAKLTDGEGSVSFELSSGNYQIRIWHPQFQPEDSDMVRDIVVKDDTSPVSVSISLSKELFPEILQDPDEFGDY